MSRFFTRRSARGLGLAALVITIVALAAAPAFAGSGSESGSGGGGGSAVADFALVANYQPPAVGYVVRGGFASCGTCTTGVEPRYPVTGFTRGWDSNTLSVVSLNGFSGSVSLEVVGLPLGVTSRTATSVSVPRRGAASTPFSLQAASFAAAGDATVTVRASGGGRTHTVVLPIAVVDALPAG
jgi:hypothetical protein